MYTTYALVPEALGRSDVFLDFQEQLSAVAKVNRPVILVGERGTGKELAAIRLHYQSRRWQGPLVAVNCSALAESLLESELFGHEPGAFTGALRLRRGRFEAAHQGTLLLDEVATMPLGMQEKILRVAEYQVVERLGGAKALEVDVRIIAATNADLPALVAQGRFKPDLLDRLAFEVLRVPPLRERIGDVALLARHFAAKMAVELERPEPPRFSASALKTLEGHSWPGNVRELKNVVERSVFRAGDAAVISTVNLDPFAASNGKQDIPPWQPGQCAQPKAKSPPSGDVSDPPQNDYDKDHPIQPAPAPDNSPASFHLPDAVADLERRALHEALLHARFNQRRAAEHLGLRYHQFRALYRKHRDALGLGREMGSEGEEG
ncbi:phage shock protein operon transcriptional activator [Desulfonatronum thioautotrophicum]|uniref:phage shock protein operon transcriptional activator n=1 Tax=Desulfonatronum thioautotrophicum TaxID=617001 RepID=UPI00129470A8|nr:phage shock protein operon transcriptional activator [Desulfonatronum thioautotrophicum]